MELYTVTIYDFVTGEQEFWEFNNCISLSNAKERAKIKAENFCIENDIEEEIEIMQDSDDLYHLIIYFGFSEA